MSGISSEHSDDDDDDAMPELSVGPFSSTQPNPTHQITDPTQPTASELIDP